MFFLGDLRTISRKVEAVEGKYKELILNILIDVLK